MVRKTSSQAKIHVSLVAALVFVAFATFVVTTSSGMFKQAVAQKPDHDGCYFLVAPPYYEGLDSPRPPGKYCRDDGARLQLDIT